MDFAASLRDAVRGLDKTGSLALLRLWEHWTMVLGEELAELGHPLGHRGDVLLIGVDDHLAQQELAFQTEEILERVNAFLDAPRFQAVTLTLNQGRPMLSDDIAPRFPPVPAKTLFAPPDPDRIGTLTDVFDPDTPIGRCYRRFVERYAPERAIHFRQRPSGDPATRPA